MTEQRSETANPVHERGLSAARNFISATSDLPASSWKNFTTATVAFFQAGDAEISDNARAMIRSLEADHVIAKMRQDKPDASDSDLANEIARRLNIDVDKAAQDPTSSDAVRLRAIRAAVLGLKNPAPSPGPSPENVPPAPFQQPAGGARHLLPGPVQGTDLLGGPVQNQFPQGAPLPPQGPPQPPIAVPTLTGNQLGDQQRFPPITDPPFSSGDRFDQDGRRDHDQDDLDDDFNNRNDRRRLNDLIRRAERAERGGEHGGQGFRGQSGQRPPPQFPGGGQLPQHAQIDPLQIPPIPDGHLDIADMGSIISQIQQSSPQKIDPALLQALSPRPPSGDPFLKAGEAIVKDIEKSTQIQYARLQATLQTFMAGMRPIPPPGRVNLSSQIGALPPPPPMGMGMGMGMRRGSNPIGQAAAATAE